MVVWRGVDRSADGEIIQGHVTLGSLRVRQDFLIAESFRAYEKGKRAPPKRRKWRWAGCGTAAHEVGHTLGLDDNYSRAR